MNIGKIVDQIKTVNGFHSFQFDDRLNLSKKEFDSILYVKIDNDELQYISTRGYGTDYYAYGYAYIVDKKCLKMSVEYFAEANYILGYHGYWTSKEDYEYHLIHGGENYEYNLLPIVPSYKKLTWKVG